MHHVDQCRQHRRLLAQCVLHVNEFRLSFSRRDAQCGRVSVRQYVRNFCATLCDWQCRWQQLVAVKAWRWSVSSAAYHLNLACQVDETMDPSPSIVMTMWIPVAKAPRPEASQVDMPHLGQ